MYSRGRYARPVQELLGGKRRNASRVMTGGDLMQFVERNGGREGAEKYHSAA